VIGGIVGGVFGALAGAAYPVFLLIWMRRKEDQVAPQPVIIAAALLDLGKS